MARCGKQALLAPNAILAAMSCLILSTWSFGTLGNRAGWPVLTAGGAALDAVVAGATAVEEDPTIDCVGLGGRPDAAGHVSLDACVMTAPNACGAVAGLRFHTQPTRIARRVMERTLHTLLVGEGADAFADREGFVRQTPLTPASQARWERWRAAREAAGDDLYRGWLPPPNAEEYDAPASHDTVCVLARDRAGRLAGACSTSGIMYKAPGRVGDSALIGHGLYVDPRVGAATATGHGELIMSVCASFLVVEQMRCGATAAEACQAALNRISDACEPRVEHQVAIVALEAAERGGRWSSAALRPGFTLVVTDAAGERFEAPDHIREP